jgi:hypothetical protein
MPIYSICMGKQVKDFTIPHPKDSDASPLQFAMQLTCDPASYLLSWHTAKLVTINLKTGWQPHRMGIHVAYFCMIKVRKIALS